MPPLALRAGGSCPLVLHQPFDEIKNSEALKNNPGQWGRKRSARHHWPARAAGSSWPLQGMSVVSLTACASACGHVCVTRAEQPLSSGAKGGHALPGLRYAGQCRDCARVVRTAAALRYRWLRPLPTLTLRPPLQGLYRPSVAGQTGHGRQGALSSCQAVV